MRLACSWKSHLPRPANFSDRSGAFDRARSWALGRAG